MIESTFSLERNADRIVGYIYESTDYDKFTLSKLNRTVSKSSVNRLIENIKNGTAKLQPIEVDKTLTIIDGQHRFSALKQLGLPITYFVQINVKILDAASQNSEQKHWKNIDYIRLFMLDGSDEYMRLYQVLNAYKPYVSESLVFSIGTKHNIMGSINKMVQTGKYKMTNYTQAIEFFDFMKMITKNAHLRRQIKQATAYAIYRIWSLPNVDRDRLEKILNKDFIMRLPANTQVATQMITDEYNKCLRIKIKYVIANGKLRFTSKEF